MHLRGPLLYCAQASASIFFSTRMEYASVENHQKIPPSEALPKSSGNLLLHNRRTLIRGFDPNRFENPSIPWEFTAARQLALPRLFYHNFCESPYLFFTTSGVKYKQTARCKVLCSFFQIKLVRQWMLSVSATRAGVESGWPISTPFQRAKLIIGILKLIFAFSTPKKRASFLGIEV